MKTPTLLALPLLILTACSSTLEKEKDSEKPEQAANKPTKQIIGRIATVSRARDFVLIQKFGPGALPKNHLYQSKGPAGRSASLRPSGERVRDFYAADLLSGEVEKGDDVIFYLNPISKKNAEKEPNHSHHEDLDTKKTHPS